MRKTAFDEHYFKDVQKSKFPHFKIAWFMKLSMIVFALMCTTLNILYARDARGQEISNTSATIILDGGSLKSAFDQIERQTPFRFAYVEKQIENYSKLQLTPGKRTLDALLSDLFLQTKLDYTVKGNMIVVVENPEKEIVSILAAPIRISGTIVNENGEPMEGVSIVVKGSSAGTTTNVEGKFALDVPAQNAVLEITRVGYLAKEVIVSSAEPLTIVLQSAKGAMEEVVVVGYGTQRRVNLTGSVSSVNMADVTKGRPVTNLSRGLAGLAAGVYVSAASNRPSSDNASILVRGQGTLNNSAPFVVIDGMEGNISSVNPEDIETISILKDAASSSIYGSRAANGVILITTKKGRSGRVQFNYNGYMSLETVANTIEPVSNYADYMGLVNEGLKNANQRAPFSQASIDVWRQNEGGDQLLYPNVDWRKEVFRTAKSHMHNISASGGSDKITFFSSFKYSDNPGIIEKAGVTRYDLRTNLEAKIKDWLSLGTNLSGGTSNIGLGSFSLDDLFTYAGASTPGMVLRAPDGRYGAVNNSEDDPQANNVLHRLNNLTGEYKKYNANTRFYGILRPFKGFVINSSFNYRLSTERRWNKPVFIDRWNFLTNTIAINGTGRSSITNVTAQSDQYFMDISGTFEKKFFNDLNMKVMAGASQEQFIYQTNGITRMDLIDPSLEVIDAAIGESSSSGSKYDWAMRSYFGRLNLNWAEKYLAEFNLRTDGSSRFLRDNRWGYFPSVSVGWRINRDIKLRGSYGSLGNNSVGNYDALSVYSLANYVLNGAVQQGLSKLSIANASLTWEKTVMANIGLDLGLLNNRLAANIDVFNKKTLGILIDLPAPLVHGTSSIPKQNSATVVNNGVELALEWKDKIGEISYFVKGNLSYIKNKVIKYKGQNYTLIGTGMIKEGLPIQVQYLRVADRIIQTDDDLALVQKIIDNAPIDAATGLKKNPFAYGTPVKGDLLYKDLNGDGLINDEDRTTFGNGPNPKYLYGFSLGIEFKGFDFSALIQGVSGIKMYYNDLYYNTYVRWGYQINKEIADGRWYDGRTTPATYPRLLDYANTKNSIANTFWLVDKSYLKIRNIQLGYTIPKKIMNRTGINGLRIYGSLENFFTFTKYPGIDPEVSGMNYPSMKQAVFGINFSF